MPSSEFHLWGLYLWGTICPASYCWWRGVVFLIFWLCWWLSFINWNCTATCALGELDCVELFLAFPVTRYLDLSFFMIGLEFRLHFQYIYLCLLKVGTAVFVIIFCCYLWFHWWLCRHWSPLFFSCLFYHRLSYHIIYMNVFETLFSLLSTFVSSGFSMLLFISPSLDFPACLSFEPLD